MPGRHVWWDLLWSRVTLAIATLTLTISTAIGGQKSRPWVVTSAAFILIHTIVNWTRDENIVRRLGRDYDRVQRRVLQLVSDLGQIAGDKYDLWMIDLYLPTWTYRLSSGWPFLQRTRVLSRQLSVSLIDARPQPPTVEAAVGPHGKSFESGTPLLWFNEQGEGPSDDNAWSELDEETNAVLSKAYGALSIGPLVDQLGKNCRGVVVIHVEPDPEKVVHAKGALRSPAGKLRISNACIDLNGLLAK